MVKPLFLPIITTNEMFRCLYPGYINRKVLDKKSFPLNDALVSA